ncbi:MAG: alpha/beta hydrolase [Candidatus Korarchaeum sp.]
MRELIAALILISLVVSCSSAAYLINGDFGRLEVRSLELAQGNGRISAIIYIPKGVEKVPAAVLVHGVSSSKESMSAIALELARRGVASLCIDVHGHGDSGGYLNLSSDPTLGLSVALDYLRLQPFVDRGSTALVGHSLGASAVRSSADRGAVAHVLIGGGASSRSAALGNATFPRNLLIVVGRGDVLFDLEKLKDELVPTFGSEVEVGRFYGDFERGTARKLVVPATTHLLEPYDLTTVSEVVDWVLRSVGRGFEVRGLVYPYRDLLMLVSLLSLLLLIFPISSALLKGGEIEEPEASLRKALVAWGLPSFLLFFPSFLIGLAIPFPPVLFANSIAIWFSLSSAYGLLLGRKRLIRPRFGLSDLSVSIAIFLVIYSVISSLKFVYGMNLWLYVPLLRTLDLRRALLLLYLLPFSLCFFYAESLLLVGRSLAKLLCVRLLPMSSALLLQYASIFAFNFKLLPSLLGFSLEFLPLMLPLFALSTAVIWWFRKLGSPSAAMLVNSLVFSWASASVFPFGGL